jgi:hypothetical protein
MNRLPRVPRTIWVLNLPAAGAGTKTRERLYITRD